MTHTKEPWASSDFAEGMSFGIESSDGTYVAEVPFEFIEPTDLVSTPQAAKANARRIVSCVNALAGIPDPAAYVAVMAEVERLSAIASRWHWNGTTEEAGGYDDKDDLFQDLLTALQSARAAKGEV